MPIPQPFWYPQTIALGSGNAVVAWNEPLIMMHPRYFSIGVLRGVGYSPLAKTGDADKGLIVGEQSLVCRNPLGAAGIFNCAP